MVQPLARKLVSLAAAFEDAAPWRKAGGAAPFLVRIPGLDHPVVASIMGEMNEELGIVIFADERGPERMLRMAARQVDGGEAYGESLVYAFCLDASSDVVGPFRKVLKAGGYRPRPLKLTPHFMVCEPFKSWRPVKQREARVLALCIHAILRAFEARALAEADGLDLDEEILELTVCSDAIEAKTAPEVTWSVIPSPIAGHSPGVHRRPFRVDSPADDPAAAAADAPSDPDSPGAWSGLVDDVIERLLDAVPVIDRRRAGRVYWGDDETAMNLSPQVCRLGAMSAFFDWIVIDHRAKEGSKTYAEKALARPRKWSERERVVLAALTDCDLAPFALEPAGVGAVELTGLLDGEECLAFGVNFPSALPEPLNALMYVIRVPGHVICRIAGPLLLRAPFDELAASSAALTKAMEAGALRGAGALLGDAWLCFAADLDDDLDALAEEADLDPDVEIEGSVVLAQVEAVIRKRYMKWLDESIPALEGHTPREAVMIVHLRPVVEQLIRSLPSLPGPGGTIDPPREELLAALGLDE